MIGNTDRHDRNWAVIRGRDNSIRLSPSFDHASSLGFALSDNERNRRLQSTDRQFVPAAFAKRARTPFAGRPHPCTIAIDGLRAAGRDATTNWLAVVSALQDRWIEVENASARLPETVSQPARRFALAVLSVNVQQFLSQVEGTLAS